MDVLEGRDSWCDICTLKLKKRYIKELALVCVSSSFLPKVGLSVWCVPPKLDMPRNLTFASIEPRGDDLLVKFEEVNDAKTLESLGDRHCIAKASDCESLQRVVEQSFVSYKLFNKNDSYIGEIVDCEDMPSQKLISVKREDFKDIVDLPLVDEFIVSVDDTDKILVVNMPEYLLDL